MTNGPCVSVILPVYNGAAYLEQAIRSIQAQTWQDWELIIVDDGSTDGSLTLCQALAAEDTRIRVLRNADNQGLARTMNHLLASAKGRYVAVQEQDDMSHPERLAQEVEVLESRPEVGLVSGIAAWLDDDGHIMTHFPGLLCKGGQYPQDSAQLVRYLYIEQMKVVNAGCMFRRSVTETLPGPFDERAQLSIDWQFALHLAHKHLIVGIPKVLISMLRGERHASLTKRKELLFREARRCIQVVFQQYRADSHSPINYWLYRRAMAAQLNLEGRYYGRLKGTIRLLHALSYNPLHKAAWLSLIGFARRALRKVAQLPITFDR